MIAASDNLLIYSALFFPLRKSRRYARDFRQWREEKGSMVSHVPLVLFVDFNILGLQVVSQRSLVCDSCLTLCYSGPCIRGHRSSKCAHKDRVLVEVRKPGRPLSACPHPSGSCGCERAVVYAVPRGMFSFTRLGTSLTFQPISDTSGPIPSSLTNSAAGTSRVQKPKMKRSNSTVTPSIVQQAMSGDPSVLAQQANHLDLSSQNTSESLSNVPSLVSSSSSTPQINAVDMGLHPRTDSMQSAGFPDIKDEDKPQLQLGMIGRGGYRTSSDVVGWSDTWPDVHAPLPLRADQTEDAAISDCCRPPVIQEESSKDPPPSSCCAPKQADLYGSARHAQQSALQSNVGQGAALLPRTNSLDGSHMNFSAHYADPFSVSDARINQFTGDATFDFFSQYESRHGCSTNGQISSHINGGGEQHECHCGDGCMCLGCSEHPGNKTTQDYARWHNEMASRAYSTGMGSLPVYFQQPLYPTNPYPYAQPLNTGPVPNLQQQQFAHSYQQPSYDRQGYDMPQRLPQQMGPSMHVGTQADRAQSYIFHDPMAPSRTVPNNSFQPPNAFQNSYRLVYQDRLETQRQLISPDSLAGRTPETPTALDGETAVTQDSPSTDQDDTNTTLSPGGFTFQEVQVPGCNNTTGDCHCGSGCDCVGCVVHSGHGGDSAIWNETSADTTQRLSEVLHMNALGSPPDLHAFSLDEFEGVIHNTIFPTTVPG
jgi:hypothetical protein